jgi:hypothetical protein
MGARRGTVRYVTYAVAAIVLLGGGYLFWIIFSQSAAAGWLTIASVIIVVCGLLHARHAHRQADDGTHRPLPLGKRGMRASRMMLRQDEGNVRADEA